MLNQGEFPTIEKYANDDLTTIASDFENKWGDEVTLLDIDIKQIYDEDSGLTTYKIIGTYRIEDVEFKLEYNCYDDPKEPELIFDEIDYLDLNDAYKYQYYMSMNQRWDAEDYGKNPHVVKASTSIFAADDDNPFADMSFDDEEDETVEDTGEIDDNLDDMADTLDEMNDALQDLDEDEIDIETDNNIADHFIAECDKCHGIFITAVIESDQELEKISGVCPLCDNETDQYLKWIIRELD